MSNPYLHPADAPRTTSDDDDTSRDRVAETRLLQILDSARAKIPDHGESSDDGTPFRPGP